jgi:hypothetical protein
MSKWKRCYYLALAIAFDIMNFSIIYEEPKPPTEEEVDQKIEDFKKMISRGEIDWD